ncbi:YqzH family protein [Halalkalibacter krulwichiae]|uniref:YqzH-like protein n=1 Tax=Halalkalibacter krulwichiae TaxID=199441 RepID=A0A1X9M9Y4_9BACI|nr:YqzH family protein [Halalkalibacter krulwichiae]ARK29464.1 hypothetical protein BkAM31D_06120 [Halalkalibacter krulwichiae]
MDITLIKKQIHSVTKSYTEQDIGLPLSQEEEEDLTKKILSKIMNDNKEPIRDVIHDVVYSFFAGQDDE